MKHSLLKVFLAFFIAGSTFAGAVSKRPPVVTYRSSSQPVELAVNSKADAKLDFVIAEGFHVQANPASQEYLIATTLEIEPSDGITAEAPVYPKGKTFRLEGSSEDISTYDDGFQITIPLKAGKDARAGNYTLKGKLRYQACDFKICLPPTSLSLELPLKIH